MLVKHEASLLDNPLKIVTFQYYLYLFILIHYLVLPPLSPVTGHRGIHMILLTFTEKQQDRTLVSKHHMTGFQSWNLQNAV